MIIKLEVLSQETIHYKSKSNGQPAQFDVLNCREATPASVMRPMRLSARDFPSVKPGSVVMVSVTDLDRDPKALAVSVRGQLVNGVAK